MSSSIAIPSSKRAQSSKIVPDKEQKNVQNYADLLAIARKHELDEEARRDLFSKGARLIRKVKPILLRHAVDSEGNFKKTWSSLSTTRCALIEQEVHKVAPWLLSFEETWATKWILKKLINQRVHDGNRAKKKEMEMEMELSWENEEERAEGKLLRTLEYYVLTRY
jgi:hypothetical protein